jgi:hypothetical protein
VVTFHELADRLTRVEVSVDVQPGSLLEKAARGMRHIKRAVRADLARFKALIEMQEVETGAWRGVIHDGELVAPHDESYDREREYADFDDIYDTESSHSPQPQENGGSSRQRSGSSSRSGGSSRQRSSESRRVSSGSASGGRSRSSSGGRSRSASSGRSRSSSGGRSRSASSGRSKAGDRSSSGSSRKRS